MLSAAVSSENSPRISKIAVSVFFPTVTMMLGVSPLIVNDQSGVGVNMATVNI